MYDVNVLGLVRTVQAVLPALRAARGHVVMTGSTAGRWVYEGGGGYTAAKHAVAALRETLRLELAEAGIRVSEVAPGMVQTEEFSLVRFEGDQARADAVYDGVEALTARGRGRRHRVGRLPAGARQHRPGPADPAAAGRRPQGPPQSLRRSGTPPGGRGRLGLPTRGTTNPNRLRRVDRHLVAVHGPLIAQRRAPAGRRPRLRRDPRHRGGAAQPADRRCAPTSRSWASRSTRSGSTPPRHATRPGLSFRRGGFELAGLRPLVVRCLNVLRQYDEAAAAEAWSTMRAGLQPGGVLIEGTCDELGRRAAWVTLDADGPRTLTLAAHLQTLDRPGDLAERLPKALIHHNVPGQPIHELLAALDDAWDRSAGARAVRQPAALERRPRRPRLAADRPSPGRRAHRPLAHDRPDLDDRTRLPAYHRPAAV